MFLEFIGKFPSLFCIEPYTSTKDGVVPVFVVVVVVHDVVMKVVVAVDVAGEGF